MVGIAALGTMRAATAAPPAQAEEIGKHLEFLGYKITIDEDKLEAQHNVYLNFTLRDYRGGMLLTAYFTGNEFSKTHQAEFLEFVNALNLGAAAARYYIDKDGDLLIEGYYPGTYDKANFGAFMDAFNLTQGQLSADSDRLLKFVN